MSAQHDYLLQFFAYEHLPDHLQAVSKPFGDLARKMVDTLPSNPERSAALRKLMEAKDSAVRALLFKQPDPLPNPVGPSPFTITVGEITQHHRGFVDFCATVGPVCKKTPSADCEHSWCSNRDAMRNRPETMPYYGPMPLGLLTTLGDGRTVERDGLYDVVRAPASEFTPHPLPDRRDDANTTEGASLTPCVDFEGM